MRAIAEEASRWCASSRAPIPASTATGWCLRMDRTDHRPAPTALSARSRRCRSAQPHEPWKDRRPDAQTIATCSATGTDYATPEFATALDWSLGLPTRRPAPPAHAATARLLRAVRCDNNNGHCRKFDAGTMCPSWRATRDEVHLTRGRANTLRLAVSGQLGQAGLASHGCMKRSTSASRAKAVRANADRVDMAI